MFNILYICPSRYLYIIVFLFVQESIEKELPFIFRSLHGSVVEEIFYIDGHEAGIFMGVENNTVKEKFCLEHGGSERGSIKWIIEFIATNS